MTYSLLRANIYRLDVGTDARARGSAWEGARVTEESVTEEDGRSRISRRNLIKAGAVVGGAVWVAPVIDSFESKAAAQSLPTVCGAKYVCGNTAFCGPTPGAEPLCGCVETIEGQLFCGGNFVCGTTATCTKDADCPPGYVCQGAGTGCCGANVCVPPCAAVGTDTAEVTTGRLTNLRKVG
jgi:hypothetical protein